jgi:hypothetical protein
MFLSLALSVCSDGLLQTDQLLMKNKISTIYNASLPAGILTSHF